MNTPKAVYLAPKITLDAPPIEVLVCIYQDHLQSWADRLQLIRTNKRLYQTFISMPTALPWRVTRSYVALPARTATIVILEQLDEESVTAICRSFKRLTQLIVKDTNISKSKSKHLLKSLTGLGVSMTITASGTAGGQLVRESRRMYKKRKHNVTVSVVKIISDTSSSEEVRSLVSDIEGYTVN